MTILTKFARALLRALNSMSYGFNQYRPDADRLDSDKMNKHKETKK